MNIADNASTDVNTNGDYSAPTCTRLTPDASPEVQASVLTRNSKTGVSTRHALSGNISKKEKAKKIPHWYALRVTYGREKKAYDYLVSKNVKAFYPTITTTKIVGGKRKSVEESRLPNIFFAHGTEDEIKSFVYDNVNLPYLRFYYRHTHEGARIVKNPLIVPDSQIESLMIICASEATDIILVPSNVQKFKEGQTVRVIEGEFKGVTGKVARYHGQQRVAVIIDGLLTIATAYIPSAFLKPTN